MKKSIKSFLIACLLTASISLNAQTHIKHYTPGQNPTTSDMAFDVMTNSGVSNNFYVAGTFSDNLGSGVIVAQTPPSGALATLNTARVYINATTRYVPTDIVEADANTQRVFITCLTYNINTNAIIGGAIISVSGIGSTNTVNWVREFTGSNWFRPFNIIRYGNDYYACGERKDANGLTQSSFCSVDLAGNVIFQGNYNPNPGISSETFMGMGVLSTMKGIFFSGRTSITTQDMKPFTTYIPFAGITNPATVWHYRGNSQCRMYGEDIIINNTSQRITVAGEGNSTSNTNPLKPFMYNTNINGTLNWHRTYDISNYTASDNIFILNVREVNGNYYLLGTREVANTYTSFIIMTNGSGVPQWAREYPVKVRANSDAFFTDGNELYFVGHALDATTNRLVPRIVNTDLNGNIIAGASCVTNLTCTSVLLHESQNILSLPYSNPSTTPTTPNASALSMELNPSTVCGNTLRVAQNSNNENLVRSTMNIYPNPSTDKLNIELPNESNYTTLYIINLNGQVIMSKAIDSKNFELDINTLPSGMYLLKAEGEDKPMIEKFIKE